MTRLSMVPVCLLAMAAPIAAQETPQPGVTAGTSGLGVVIPLSERVAIRPEITFGGGWQDHGPTLWKAGTGASGIFYLTSTRKFRPYLTPHFSIGFGNTPSASSTQTLRLTGSLGGEYTLTARFGVFAEGGLGYTRERVKYYEGTPMEATRTREDTGPRVSVGMIIRFKK